jgi:hypothetical protein
MSAAMLVRIHKLALCIKGTFFLKLYDRCCDSDGRETVFPEHLRKNLQHLTTEGDMKYYKYLWTEEGATRLEKKLDWTYTELGNGINSKEGDEKRDRMWRSSTEVN